MTDMKVIKSWNITRIDSKEDLSDYYLDLAEAKLQGVLSSVHIRRLLLIENIRKGSPQTGDIETDAYNNAVMVCQNDEADHLAKIAELLESIKNNLCQSRGQ